MEPSQPKILDDLSRRHFLFSSLATVTSLLASPIQVVANTPTTKRDEKGHIWLKLAHTVLPPSEYEKTKNIGFKEEIERILNHLPSQSVSTINSVLVLFDKLSWLIGWNFSSFTNLERKQALAYCQKWQNGFKWQTLAFNGIKSIIYTAYWSQPKTWPAIGYPGPVSVKNKIPVLGNASLPSRYQRNEI